jgi:D-alanyl-D-alanine dipeptidase
VGRAPRLWLLAAGLLACGPVPARPPEFVDAAARVPGLELDIRYAGSHNFVGAPIDGYLAPKCLLTRDAARALARVQEPLRVEGLGLRVFDCYRPQRAVDAFVRWARDPEAVGTKSEFYPRVPKSRLFADGYIAARSGHSRGSTLDLTLVRLGAGPLDMGTPFDFFDPRSHTDSPDVTAEQRAHRERLRAAMQAEGFTNLPEEWWHYSLRDEPFPDRYFDFPVE